MSKEVSTGVNIKWLPIAVELALILVTMGAMYGALDGRLKLIEYRLTQIERHIGVGVPAPVSAIPAAAFVLAPASR